MALGLRGSASVPTGNPTTGFNVTVDSAVQSGDLLFLTVTSRDSTDAGTLAVTDNDTGGNTWSKIGNSTDHKATLWYKRATSATASKTVTVSNAVGSSAGVLKAFSGGSVGTVPYAQVNVEANASGDESATGLTVTRSDSIVCASIHNYDNDNSVTALAADIGNYTATEKTSNGGSDCGCSFGHAPLASGATGNVTWSQTDGQTYTITWEILRAWDPATASVGAFTLSGQAANFAKTYTLAAGTGAFTFSGISVGLNKAYTFTSDVGAFTFSGVSAGLFKTYATIAETGAFTVSGIDAALDWDQSLTAEVGAFVLAGQDAGLLISHVLTAGTGTFVLTGNDAGLALSGGNLTAETGVFTVAGVSAGLTTARVLSAELGTFSLSGIDAGLATAKTLSAGTGAFVFTGNGAGLAVGPRTLSAAVGTFNLVGNDAGLSLGTRILTADRGQFVVAGQIAQLELDIPSSPVRKPFKTGERFYRPGGRRLKSYSTARFVS